MTAPYAVSCMPNSLKMEEQIGNFYTLTVFLRDGVSPCDTTSFFFIQNASRLKDNNDKDNQGCDLQVFYSCQIMIRRV